MSETVKLIIEIPKGAYLACRALKTDNDQGILTFCVVNAVADGTPLDDVKDKILGYNVRQHVSGSESFLRGYALGMDKSAEILDSIGKGDKE